jgi:hypothetical protein
MGLIRASVRGLFRVFEEVADLADKELYDGDAVRNELMEIYQQLESGALTEEEFSRRETELVLRLEEIEEHNEGRGNHGNG